MDQSDTAKTRPAQPRSADQDGGGVKPLRRDSQFPGYPERVVQFGGGVFLRGFADWMIAQMNHHAGFASFVVICQGTPGNTVERLNRQEGLFTVCLTAIRDGRPQRACELVTCVTRGIDIAAEYDAFLRLAEQPELRFAVSNTTEAGIRFDPDDAYACPTTFPGRLTALLHRRWQAFAGDTRRGLIILPCELIERNGEQLHAAVQRYIQHWNLENAFQTWVDTANCFCTTLVDRIVPGFPHARAEELWESLGYRDELLVEAERFHLWVIEAPDWVRSEFPAEAAGLNVRFVPSIEPYRAIKVRILNGAHTAMTPVGLLLGQESVAATITDARSGRFVREAIAREILPTLATDDAAAFARDVLARFANPCIHHKLADIALNSFAKWRTRILPTLEDYQARTGTLPRRLCFSIAALIALYRAPAIPLKDSPAVLDLLTSLSGCTATEAARLVLADTRLWDRDLTTIPGLADLVTKDLQTIEEQGMATALERVQA